MGTLANSDDPNEMPHYGNPQMCSLASSEDPDEMPQYAAFHQDLHCTVYFFTVEKYHFFILICILFTTLFMLCLI